MTLGHRTSTSKSTQPKSDNNFSTLSDLGKSEYLMFHRATRGITGRVGCLSPRARRNGEAGGQSAGWEQKVLHIMIHEGEESSHEVRRTEWS